ncbi:hypothetical protein FPANT_13819, partial [Fusarium pseudoanthophilum]
MCRACIDTTEFVELDISKENATGEGGYAGKIYNFSLPNTQWIQAVIRSQVIVMSGDLDWALDTPNSRFAQLAKVAISNITTLSFTQKGCNTKVPSDSETIVPVDGTNYTVPNQCVYQLTFGYRQALGRFIEKTLFNTLCVAITSGGAKDQLDCGDQWWLPPLYNSTFEGLDASFDMFTTAITNNFRRQGIQAIRNGSMEENDKASGQATEMAICTVFDWRWVLLPAGLVAITMLLLIVAVVQGFTNPGMPVWKTSILPLLFYGPNVSEGTDNRDETAAWPPAKFNDDPSSIPNDEAYNIPYDPASKKAKSSVFELYSDLEQTKRSDVPPPKLVAKRYLPTNQVNKPGPGVTLLTLTGMGVPKEMFEPMLETLLPRLRKSGVKVEEIWAIDMPLSGQTAKANPVGYLYANEKDIVRDLLLLLTAYLPVQPGKELPKYLQPRTPTDKAQQPTRQNLHVFAHSLGAQASILASVHAPNIFSSLMVVDPAMIPAGKINDAMTKLPKEIFCLGLKETFPDRNAVETALCENKR